jgi:hypothetical protein
MASPLNNPWISGGLGAGILVYFTVSFTPEAWKRPVRDFFTGELRREGGKEPELKTGTEKMFRAAATGGPERLEAVLAIDGATQRNLFREIPKGVREKPKENLAVPEVPEGSGLLAVWMEGETRVAVMTDGPVREGEPWGQFTVEKITPEAVTLRHEAGERVVRLGDIRAKAGGPVVATSAPKDAKAPAGSAEAQLQKLIETQKSLDPSKLLQGFPQKMLDSLMGTTPKPATPQ